MSDEHPCSPRDSGAPAWVMTFADLMSLLMCFFVLLLAFSEIDARKFKQIAGSLRMAFGVQRQIEAVEIPLGTSIVAQEFSPSPPKETVQNVIQQQSRDDLKVHLDSTEKQQEQIEHEAEEIRQRLKKEIDAGLLNVETEAQKIIIRIEEKGSFPSGSAELKPGFAEAMDKIIVALSEHEGKIVVAGHTDDIPISTRRFRSNWELSASRAVTVAHELLKTNQVSEDRLLVEGHAETHPMVPNTSWANRAKNRRVEIVLQRDWDRAGPMGKANREP